MRFAEKVVVVTGGNSGIGESAVRRFAAERATVVIAARDASRSDQVAGSTEGDIHVVGCDVTSESDCRAVAGFCEERFGRVDVLFNNAGIIYREKTAPDTSLEEWNRTMAVNATGTFLMSKYLIPLMAPGSAIVNNASYFGLVGGRGAAAYSASKGAVVLLTKAMALDHAADGIRVNCVCAGSVYTPMLRGEMGGEAAIRPTFEAKHPLGRIADPDEIASLVLFLASKDAGFMTGAAVPIDGGITAG